LEVSLKIIKVVIPCDCGEVDGYHGAVMVDDDKYPFVLLIGGMTLIEVVGLVHSFSNGEVEWIQNLLATANLEDACTRSDAGSIVAFVHHHVGMAQNTTGDIIDFQLR
jgi:hypothetical protein